MVRTKRFFSLIFSLFVIAVLPACWETDQKNAEPKEKDFALISVLNKKHHDDCHIPGSVWVPFADIAQYAQNNIDKNAEIILYCNNYMCSTSGFARKKLADLGFTNVFAYEGGVAEWLQLGYPVVGKAESAYLKNKLKTPAQTEEFVLTAQQLKEKLESRGLI